LQYILKRLKPGGKCAIIVPNGFLFGDGAAQYVKKKLLTNFNLHHIILLPEGVFSPYTSIPTNILFFDKGESTKNIHYIQVPPPNSGKHYTKTNPIHAKYFTSVAKLWDDNEVHSQSWTVPVDVFHNNGYDLSPQNPSELSNFQKSHYKETISELKGSVEEFSKVLKALEVAIKSSNKDDWEFKPLKNLIIEVSNDRKELVELDKEYTFLGVSGEAKGAFTKEPILGSEIRANNVYKVKEKDLIYNRLFAWKGSFSQIPPRMNNCYVSNEFPIFIPKDNIVSTTYISFYLSHPRFWTEVEHKSRGSTPGSRNRLYQDKFLDLIISVPISAKMAEIEAIVGNLTTLKNKFTVIKEKFDYIFEDLPKQMVLEMFKSSRSITTE
ncbi:MAG: N-6 DNA methylase, partial [Candidatus Hodarchaeales archaeon]|jgi:type I restriction enzyme M protein